MKRNGKEEVTLRSYEMLQSEELLYSNVMEAMLSGVSTRDFNTIHKPLPGGRELSKSKVSQAFIKASEASYQELNSRDFSEHNFTAIMIDAIHFSQRAVICALWASLLMVRNECWGSEKALQRTMKSPKIFSLLLLSEA